MSGDPNSTCAAFVPLPKSRENGVDSEQFFESRNGYDFYLEEPRVGAAIRALMNAHRV